MDYLECNDKKTNKKLTIDIHEGVEYDASVCQEKRARALNGSGDTAVILLHGFIASPGEVVALGREINKYGFTVLMPLLDGFGGSTALANTADYMQWKKVIPNSINLLSRCYEKVILIGFSLGGALVSEYLTSGRKHPQVEVVGAVLLAPYYAPKCPIVGCAVGLSDIFDDSISLTKFYRAINNADLKIPIANPIYYNSDMPYKAVKQIIKFGKELRGRDVSTMVDIPILLAYTERDKTVHNGQSVTFAHKHFSDVRMIVYPKERNIKHQMTVRAGNPLFDLFAGQVVRFVKGLEYINTNM